MESICHRNRGINIERERASAAGNTCRLPMQMELLTPAISEYGFIVSRELHELLMRASTNEAELLEVLAALFQVFLLRFSLSPKEPSESEALVEIHVWSHDQIPGKWIRVQNVLAMPDNFRGVLSSIRRMLRESRGNSRSESAESKIGSERDLAGTFRNAIAMDETGTAEWILNGIRRTGVDLCLVFRTGASVLQGRAIFDSSRIEQVIVSAYVRSFCHIANQLLANIDVSLGEISLNPAADVRREWFPEQEQVYGNGYLSVIELFEQQVNASVDRVAIVAFDELANIYNEKEKFIVSGSVTYAELNQRVNQMAHMLIARGIGRDNLVGVLVQDPIGKIEALMGVLKAGAAYVAINKRYPEQVQERLVTDCNCGAILDDGSGSSILRNFYLDDQVVNLDTIDRSQWNNSNPGVRCDPNAACYACFTSGTTALMKAVIAEHGGLAAYTSWRTRILNLAPRDTALQLVPYSADGSCATLFPCLCSGGTLVAIPEAWLGDPGKVRIVLDKIPITHISVLPSFLLRLRHEIEMEHFRALRLLILAGEPVTSEVVALARRLAPDAVIVNEYGPTEATVGVTAKVGTAAFTASSIGIPRDGTKIRVTLRGGACAPPDVPGELLLGGAGIARGYLNDPDATADRFIVQSRTHRANVVFKTGDLVRQTAIGEIVFMRRLDRQAKIQGNRVDLDTLECVLATLLEAHSVELKQEMFDEMETPALCAYIITDQVSRSEPLIRDLRTRLAPYMIPDRYFFTRNIATSGAGTCSADHPEIHDRFVSETERRVAEVFVRVLRINAQEVDRTSNFFDLGGQSLKVTQLAALIQKAVGVNLKISQIYNSPTVKTLANIIQEAKERAWQKSAMYRK